jgi:hypothetical protein
MIKIPISEVKKFIGAAKPIKDTRLLPIYAYVKLSCDGDAGVFYKANGISFVVCDVNAEFKKSDSFLIEEKTLFGFVQYSSGKDLMISKKGDIVTLNDGSRNISCKVPPAEHFSAIQQKNDEESVVLTEVIINSLFLAKNHIFQPTDTEMRPPSSFVHMTKVDKVNYIAAWNGQVGYLKSFKEKLPTLSLDPEAITTISKFQIVSYSRVGNYDYFDGGGISYGFAKHEVKTPDITKLVENFKQQQTFTVNRKPFVDFCEMVINVNSSSIAPIVSISPAKNSVLLNFKDASENQNAEESVPAIGEIGLKEPFHFQPKNMLTVLKDLGCEKVSMSYVQQNLIIKADDDKNYTGSVMELSVKN